MSNLKQLAIKALSTWSRCRDANGDIDSAVCEQAHLEEVALFNEIADVESKLSASQAREAELREKLKSYEEMLRQEMRETNKAHSRAEEAELMNSLQAQSIEMLSKELEQLQHAHGVLAKHHCTVDEQLEEAEAKLKEQEMAISLYREDVERIWALFPELRNTDAHYDIFEAVHEKILTSHKKGYDQAMKEISKAPVVATVKRLNGATVDLNLGGLGRHVVDTGNALELKIGDELIIRPTIKNRTTCNNCGGTGNELAFSACRGFVTCSKCGGK